MEEKNNQITNLNSVDLPGENSPVEDLRIEVEKAKRAPEHFGIFAYKTANDWMKDAALLPDPKVFYHGLIVQYDITALFGPTGSGKTVFAMQIAEEISRYYKVFYIDLELSQKQFQLRFTGPDGAFHFFQDNFVRAEVDPDYITQEDFEVGILDSIEEAAKAGLRFFILDNVTFACNDNEKGSTAGTFMMRLLRLKKKYFLTLICIAHTPKLRGYEPLTSSSMAGSAKLMNFFDQGIAVGISAKDSRLRYVKQVKTRSLETTYDSENVIVYEVVMVNGTLRYEYMGHAREEEHLKHGNPADDMDEILAILKLKAAGKSLREIAETLEISLGKVQRRLKKAKEQNITLESIGNTDVSNVSPVLDTIQPIQSIQEDEQDLPLFNENGHEL